MPTFIAAGLTAIGVSAGTALAVGQFLTSVAFQIAGQLLLRRKGADASDDVAGPTSIPAYRIAFGKGVRIKGTPAPWLPVNPLRARFACFILNSEPSAGTNARILIDKRDVGLSGDLFDFGDVGRGTVTVAEGATQATIAHTLAGTPTAAQIGARAGDAALDIDQITATHFRVTLPDPAPAGGTEVVWAAARRGGGATATHPDFQGYARFWMGRGDQEHPPADVLLDWGDLNGLNREKFWASDMWKGRTVLWCRLDRGPRDSEARRWPTNPAEIEVEADWTRLWDPRDAAQDADDPSTWPVSDNQGQALLHAMRFNPIAAHDLDQIILAQLIEAANVADIAVPRKGGGTDPKYRVGGLLIFDGGAELVAQLDPLARAGGGRILRTGGQLGYLPGAYYAPEVTLTSYLEGQSIRYQSTRRTRGAYRAVKAIFPDREHNFEASELDPFPVDPDYDGSEDRVMPLDLLLVPYARQAMRLQKIEAMRIRLGREFRASYPPSALEVQAGTPVALDFSGQDYRNGAYVATETRPAVWISGEQGDALDLPIHVTQIGPEIYAWDAETEEQDRPIIGFTPVDLSLEPPINIMAVASADFPRIDISWGVPGLTTEPNDFFTASAGASEWQVRINQGAWQPGGQVASPFGFQTPVVTVFFNNPFSPASHGFRARMIDDGNASAWVYSNVVQTGFVLGVPTDVSATSGAGQNTIAATSPDNSDHHALQYWGSDTDDFFAAELLAEQVVASATADSFVETGLGAGVTRYYFVRSVTAGGATGPVAASVSATTT